jgi:hypothetical protein
MNTWIRRSLQVGIVSAGIVLAGAAAAHADSDLTSIGNLGILNGNQAYVPVQVPVDVCGNAAGVLGNAQASCKGGSSAHLRSLPDATSIGNAGIGNGNQLIAPIQVPVEVSGNALGALGNGAASSKGGSDASIGHGHHHYRGSALPDATSIGNLGILNGNQAIVPVQLPVNVSGNAAGVLGNGQASSKGGSQAKIGHGKKAKGGYGHSRKAKSTDLTSIGNFGILNGNQLYAPIQIPVDVCGNALGVLGNAQANCKGGSRATLKNGGGSDLTSIGNAGILNGNQAYVPIQIPVDVSGNALGLLGNGAASSKGGASAHQ